MKLVVLVVDDEPLQRGILKTILDCEGYETITAGSGSEALAAVRKVPPDVVVSDLKMAGMDGIELMGALPQSPAPPVIIVTAQGTIDSAVEAVKLGAFDYLTKPCKPGMKSRCIMTRAAKWRSPLKWHLLLPARLRSRSWSPSSSARPSQRRRM